MAVAALGNSGGPGCRIRPTFPTSSVLVPVLLVAGPFVAGPGGSRGRRAPGFVGASALTRPGVPAASGTACAAPAASSAVVARTEVPARPPVRASRGGVGTTANSQPEQGKRDRVRTASTTSAATDSGVPHAPFGDPNRSPVVVRARAAATATAHAPSAPVAVRPTLAAAAASSPRGAASGATHLLGRRAGTAAPVVASGRDGQGQGTRGRIGTVSTPARSISVDTACIGSTARLVGATLNGPTTCCVGVEDARPTGRAAGVATASHMAPTTRRPLVVPRMTLRPSSSCRTLAAAAPAAATRDVAPLDGWRVYGGLS